jgi:hypothetical protein
MKASGLDSNAAFDPCAESPAVRRYLDERIGSSAPVLTAIAEADEMYRYNVVSLKGSQPCAAILYYAKGRQIFEAIRAVARWRFGSLGGVGSMLDFASGHGRVTRFLVGEVDPKRICACEIHPDAIEFQREYFGVGGLLSSMDPGKFDAPGRFPLVAASSFFSHVPRPAFEAWIARLLECVTADGVVIFSVLSTELLPADAPNISEGFVFFPASETDRLDKTAYGTAYVDERFVREAVARGAAARRWSVRRFPRGLCGLQDLYVVADLEEPDTADFELPNFPWGDADIYELKSDGCLAVAGWLSHVSEPLSAGSVEFSRDGTSMASAIPERIAPAQFRWRFEADSRDIGVDDVLMVSAVIEGGLENIVALGTLRTHPPMRVP